MSQGQYMKAERIDRETFAECLRVELQRVLTSVGIGGQIDPADVAMRTLDAVSVQWGGDRAYIAQRSKSMRVQRDSEILALVAVGNRSEALEKYGISERRLRQIVARERIEKAGNRAGEAYRRLTEE